MSAEYTWDMCDQKIPDAAIYTLITTRGEDGTSAEHHFCEKCTEEHLSLVLDKVYEAENRRMEAGV